MDSLEELSQLAKTADFSVEEQYLQVVHRVIPSTLLGSGKLEQIALKVQEKNIQSIIFNQELTPTQIKNLENCLKTRVMTRSEVILEIFRRHAQSRPARLQVEHAQLRYLFPRLTRRWKHLSRIQGGIGFRGPGETQLEVDRQHIKKRLDSIQKELKKIRKQSKTRRKKRELQNLVSVIGYTNAGKSQLINSLTRSNLLVDSRVFATLDSYVRKAYISPSLNILLTDTIGFIERLPYELIASFESTLEEIRYSQLLLHVIDSSKPNALEQLNTVNQILQKMNLSHMPYIYVLNKVDLVPENSPNYNRWIRWQKTQDFPSCFVSAKKGEGFSLLKRQLENFFLYKTSQRNYIHSSNFSNPSDPSNLLNPLNSLRSNIP